MFLSIHYFSDLKWVFKVNVVSKVKTKKKKIVTNDVTFEWIVVEHNSAMRLILSNNEKIISKTCLEFFNSIPWFSLKTDFEKFHFVD